ncbi:MAG: MBL fold metallo-hydrolase [Nitrospira sp.]
MFCGYASPIPMFGKAFAGSDVYTVDDMPPIDVLVLTHDHYDHLDYQTVVKLNAKVKQVVTSLGVGEHLEHWGIAPEKITELDWWETATLPESITITAAPARHFSGRGITRAKTLWSSFILTIHGYQIYIGGDSGYGKHFKEIGERYIKFDLALLESGQYGVGWPNIHMQPRCCSDSIMLPY